MQRRQHAVERCAAVAIDLDHMRILGAITQPRQRTQAPQDLGVARAF